MEYSKKPSIVPRIIIHGGAGNITRCNMPQESYDAYSAALLHIVRRADSLLQESSALDVATYAVSLLEENPLFNAGRGAVYTTAGTHELEASVMVSTGYRKRGVGVMNVRKAKSPIKLAREMLIRGELPDGGGAQGHCQLQGDTIDKLAEQWGLELAQPSYFWTRKRWDEHRRGLGLPHDDKTYDRHRRDADATSLPEHVTAHEQNADLDLSGDIHWDGKEYLPQGTVGAVVLDKTGTIAVATSTGGITNKLPGRIGDTPTLGAGFWAEEWHEASYDEDVTNARNPLSSLSGLLAECLPIFRGYIPVSTGRDIPCERLSSNIRAVAMSGTGNGDSFLRVNAVRTAAAITRYAFNTAQAQSSKHRHISLQQAVASVAGPHGQLQNSAGDRWHKTGEGEGGIIGIELEGGQGKIVFDYNCGGMFHAWIDTDGHAQFGLFQDSPRPPP